MADHEAELGALERIMGDASAEPTNLPYELIKSITDNFSKEIGRGGFGVVYLGVLRSGKVAVKKLSISADFSDELFSDEVRCLLTIKHSNIVRFLGYCSDTQGEVMQHDGEKVMAQVLHRLLVFDYAPNGSLQPYIKEKTIKWGRRYQMIKGICHGLQYLHTARITHLDLKPENVLLDAQMEPKITDFGLSRCFHEGQSRIFTKSTPGTRGYIAPEIIEKGEITFKSDIFSLGIIVTKLLTGSDNFDFDNWHQSIDANNPQVQCCIEIALTCVAVDQHKRPSIDEIIHKLNAMDSIEESRDDSGSSIHQVSGSALKELPPSMSCVDSQDGEKIKKECNKLQLSAHKGPTEDTSLAKNDGLIGHKGSRDAKKMDLTLQRPVGLKPPPPPPTRRLLPPPPPPPPSPPRRLLPPPPPPPPPPSRPRKPPPPVGIIWPPAQRMEDPFNHSDSFDDVSDGSDCFCVDDHWKIAQEQRRHNGALDDKARAANAGSGGKKIPVDGGGSNKADSKDWNTDFTKGDKARTSGDHPNQGKMGNVASIPTVAVHSPMVGNEMHPEQMMMRYPNTMEFRPWVAPYPLQAGGEGGGGVSGREVLQVAAVAQNSMALQQQHMSLMGQQQQQQHMAFYLFLFLFLFMFSTIVIIIVILTFKKRG